MWLKSRKYLRINKKILISNILVKSVFKKKTLSKSKSSEGSKLTPHKNTNLKSFKYNIISNVSYKRILNFSLFMSRFTYIYDDFKNKYFKLNITDLGILFLTPGILQENFTVNSGFSNFIGVGSKNVSLPLFKFSVGDIVSNIKSNTNGFWCSSSGTFGIVKSNKIGLISFLLPSGDVLELRKPEAYLGKNIYLNKYSNYRANKTLVSVRGVAKNPVDHPNGGRSNTKGSLKTPWGKVAKNNK